MTPPADDPQVWYTDRSSHYTNVALGKVNNGQLADWNPQNGWAANRDWVIGVYGYYAGLALAQPDLFLWAGLGRMAGGAVVGGMDSNPVLPEAPFISIGRDIFYDLVWQHEAYLDAPDTIVKLADLHDQYGQFPQYASDGTETFAHVAPATSYGDAWRKITSGDPAQIAAGNRDLLMNEQATIVQPGYDYLLTVTGSGLVSPFTDAIHPYHRDFLIDFPQGNILKYADRWAWIALADGMFDHWAAAGTDAAHPDNERTRLLQLPFDSLLKRNFGVPGRPDLLPPGEPGDNN
jgi:hypothetical protein